MSRDVHMLYMLYWVDEHTQVHEALCEAVPELWKDGQERRRMQSHLELPLQVPLVLGVSKGMGGAR